VRTRLPTPIQLITDNILSRRKGLGTAVRANRGTNIDVDIRKEEV
jgi:hypothetical protein